MKKHLMILVFIFLTAGTLYIVGKSVGLFPDSIPHRYQLVISNQKDADGKTLAWRRNQDSGKIEKCELYSVEMERFGASMTRVDNEGRPRARLKRDEVVCVEPK